MTTSPSWCRKTIFLNTVSETNLGSLGNKPCFSLSLSIGLVFRPVLLIRAHMAFYQFHAILVCQSIWLAHNLDGTLFSSHIIWLAHYLADTPIGWHTNWLAHHLVGKPFKMSKEN